jgi:hypothetical protein
MPKADLIKRFTKTPFETLLRLSDTRIRVETNCQCVADQVRQAPTSCTASALDNSDFVLRLVAEFEDDLEIETAGTVHCLSTMACPSSPWGRRSSWLATGKLAKESVLSPRTSLPTKSGLASFLPGPFSLLEQCLERAGNPCVCHRPGAPA